MHDLLRVGGGDRLGQGDGDVEESVKREAVPRQERGEGLPLDQLHRDEVDAAILLHRMHGDDAGMVERGENLRFAREAREPVAIEREQIGQHLHGHVAVERRIACAIHLAHPARAQQCRDLV